MKNNEIAPKSSRKIYRFLILVCTLALITAVIIFYKADTAKSESYTKVTGEESDKIENGIHLRTGLVDAPGLQETVNNCTSCHSAKLVIQNKMSAERWHATIRWMQETQNLWDLGKNEEIIVNYLVTNYPPGKKGRRAALTEIEWYDLNQ